MFVISGEIEGKLSHVLSGGSLLLKCWLATPSPSTEGEVPGDISHNMAITGYLALRRVIAETIKFRSCWVLASDWLQFAEGCTCSNPKTSATVIQQG